MLTVIYKREFQAAHFLPDYEGKCRNVHGHNYVAEMEFCGTSVDRNGMLMVGEIVVDFELIKRLSDEVLPDHQTLNEWMPEPPSTENVARVLFWRMRAVGLPIAALTVWETERGGVKYVPSLEEVREWEVSGLFGRITGEDKTKP